MAHKTNCDECTQLLSYSEDWDARYCEICNEWKDKKCSETNININQIECFYECWNRPERPLEDK